MNRTAARPSLEDAIQNPPGACSLCRRKYAPYVGIFVPRPEFGPMIGQPAGKQRIVVYSLCQSCMDLPDREKRLEESMVAAFSEGQKRQ